MKIYVYIQSFKNINNFTAENEINFEENSNLEIITDFELTSINAINEVFNFATHSACFFFILHNKFTEKSIMLVLAEST